jgi:hypothetical protein
VHGFEQIDGLPALVWRVREQTLAPLARCGAVRGEVAPTDLGVEPAVHVERQVLEAELQHQHINPDPKGALVALLLRRAAPNYQASGESEDVGGPVGGEVAAATRQYRWQPAAVGSVVERCRERHVARGILNLAALDLGRSVQHRAVSLALTL